MHSGGDHPLSRLDAVAYQHAESRRKTNLDRPLKLAAGRTALRMTAVMMLCAPLLRILRTIEDGDFYVLAVAVDRAMRGAGVGSALMDAMEDRGRASGSSRLTLDVSARNAGARKLYERRGMAVVSRWPKRLPLTALRFYRMAKSLQDRTGR